MKPQEIANQTVATIRASKNVELRMAANEHPEVTMTLEDTANVVDQALQGTLLALVDDLGNEDEDGQSERDSWWAGYPEGHPYDWRKGGIPEEGWLPRTSSWWEGCPC